TTTPSMFRSRSSSRRQSLYFTASGYALNDSAACWASTAQRAPIFAPVSLSEFRLSAPRPPAPITARSSVSLGARRAAARAGTARAPATAAAPARKERRLSGWPGVRTRRDIVPPDRLRTSTSTLLHDID